MTSSVRSRLPTVSARVARSMSRMCSSRGRSAAGLGECGDDPGGVGVEDGQLVVLGQGAEAADHRHEIVAGPPGLRADGPAGPRRLGAGQHLADAPLPDRRLQEDQIIAAGVVEEVIAEILLRGVRVGGDEAVQRADASRQVGRPGDLRQLACPEGPAGEGLACWWIVSFTYRAQAGIRYGSIQPIVRNGRGPVNGVQYGVSGKACRLPLLFKSPRSLPAGSCRRAAKRVGRGRLLERK